MSDLYLAIAVMGAASLALGLWGALAARPAGQLLVLMLTLALAGGFAFLWYAAGRLYWAAWIPTPAVIVWSNWVPLLLGVAAGWAWRLPQTPRWRRGLAAGALAAATVPALFWPLLGPMLRPPPPGDDLWLGGVAMQSSWATCSPAAATTLLAAEGLEASEHELIDRCLTDQAGTPTLGLYRGLALTAQAAGREVQVVQTTVDQLLQSDDWPVLLLVELPRTGVDDPRYEEQWGWIPGLGHSVVAFGLLPDGTLDIGDPSVGRERWRREDLSVLWHGDGLRVTEP